MTNFDPHLPLIQHPSPNVRSEIQAYREETTLIGLSSSEDRMLVAWVILSPKNYNTGVFTDGQTDRLADLLWLVQLSAV